MPRPLRSSRSAGHCWLCGSCWGAGTSLSWKKVFRASRAQSWQRVCGRCSAAQYPGPIDSHLAPPQCECEHYTIAPCSHIKSLNQFLKKGGYKMRKSRKLLSVLAVTLLALVLVGHAFAWSGSITIPALSSAYTPYENTNSSSYSFTAKITNLDPSGATVKGIAQNISGSDISVQHILNTDGGTHSYGYNFLVSGGTPVRLRLDSPNLGQVSLYLEFDPG